jgi:hypothetical protein
MISSVGKQLDNVVATAKLAAKVKTDITIGSVNGKTIESQPGIQKIKRRGLGRKALTKEHAAEMVDKKAIASLTIETTKTLYTRAVSTGILYDETKIERVARRESETERAALCNFALAQIGQVSRGPGLGIAGTPRAN